MFLFGNNMFLFGNNMFLFGNDMLLFGNDVQRWWARPALDQEALRSSMYVMFVLYFVEE